MIEDIARKVKREPVQCRQHFFEQMPFTERLCKESGDNKRVWIILAEKLRLNVGSHHFRAGRRQILPHVLTFIGILDTTCGIEQIFSKLQLLESRRRGGRMGLFALEDGLRVAWSLPQNLNYYVHESIEPIDGSTMMATRLKPAKILQESMVKCTEYFGPCRSSASQTVSTLGPTKVLQLQARPSHEVHALRITKPAGNGKVIVRQRNQRWI